MYYLFLIFTISIIFIKFSFINNLLKQINMVNEIIKERIIIKDFKEKKIKYFDILLDVFVIISLYYLAKYDYKSTLLLSLSVLYFLSALVHYYYLNKFIKISKQVKQAN